MNGMAIRTGCIVDDKYYLILVDVDNKDDTEKVKNGMKKWEELIKKKKINTPTQKTGNNGLHYLFKVPDITFNKLKSSGTELAINGQKYSIDFKGKNQFMIVDPSSYGDKYYEWIVSIDTDIQEMPKWLKDIIINNNKTEKTKRVIAVNKSTNDCKIIKNISQVDKYDDDVIPLIKTIEVETIVVESIEGDKQINYSDDDIEYLLTLLSSIRRDNYDDWIKVGMCLHNINKMYLLM
jgi:hypothetical protein